MMTRYLFLKKEIKIIPFSRKNEKKQRAFCLQGSRSTRPNEAKKPTKIPTLTGNKIEIYILDCLNLNFKGR